MRRGFPTNRKRLTGLRSRNTAVRRPLTSSSLQSSVAPRRIKNKLYVCGLLPTVLREELIREFGPYGKLQEVWVAKKPPGFAFVEFVNARDAERVVHELDGAKILGSKVRIEFAKASKVPEEFKTLKKYFPPPGQSGIPSILPPSELLSKPPLLPGPPTGSTIPLLNSPPIPVATASGVKLGMLGPTGETRKRRRYDSSDQADAPVPKPLLSPPPRRFSRSPVPRGRLLSPPPKRNLLGSPEFRRKVDIPSLLPPPPSRRANLSPMNKLPRPPEVRRRFSKSPMELRQSGRKTSFGRDTRVVRSPIRWPSNRDGYHGSPGRERRSTAAYNRNNSLDRVHDGSPYRRKRNCSLDHCEENPNMLRHRGAMTPDSRSSSREEDGGAAQKKLLVKSQIKSVAPSVQGTNERTSSEVRMKDVENSDSDASKSSRSRSKDTGKGANIRSTSPSKYKRTISNDSENRKVLPNRSLSKSPVRSEQRDSVSLRRNFQRTSWRRDSDGHSPPLNVSRTRLLGRTPPSPPVRSPPKVEKSDRQSQQFGPQKNNNPVRELNKFKNKAICRSPSKSYESEHSPVMKQIKTPPKVSKKKERSVSRTSSRSKSTKVKQGHKKMRKQSTSSSSSSSGSESSRSSSPPPQKIPKVTQPVKKYMKPGPQRSSSRYSENERSKQLAHVSRPRKGGPRSPSESSVEKSPPDKNSSRSKSASQSSESKSTSRGRRTPLAYQHRRESLSPEKNAVRNKSLKSPPSKRSPPQFGDDRVSDIRNHSPDPYPGARIRSYRSKYESPSIHYPQPHYEEDSRYRVFRKSPPMQRPIQYYEEADRGYFGESSSYHHPSARHPPYIRGSEVPMRISRPGYYPGENIPKDPYFRRHRELMSDASGSDYYRSGPRHYLLPPPVFSSYRGNTQFPAMSRGRYEGQTRPYHRNYEPYRGRIRNPPIFFDNSNKEKKTTKED